MTVVLMGKFHMPYLWLLLARVSHSCLTMSRPLACFENGKFEQFFTTIKIRKINNLINHPTA